MPRDSSLERISKLEVDTPQGYSGVLGNEKGSYLFSYDRSATPEREVSLLMPLRTTQYSSGALQPVFAMNLPEGFVLEEIRNRLAKVARIDPLLLLAITGDSHPIGRLTMRCDALKEVVPDRGALPAGENLQEILHWDGTEDIFQDLVERYVLRSGISGVQPKVVVPERATANTSELIVKSGRDEYEHLAINEYVCMSIAKTAGLPVPDFWLSDNHQLFVMRRFDLGPDGERLGFEDFAALMGKDAEKKYVGSYAMIARAIRLFVAPEHLKAALDQLFDTVVLSCAVGNGDAHLKNFGVLYEHPQKGDVRLSPVYDIVNTTAYIPNDSLALKLGNGKAFAGQARLLEFARDCDVSDGAQRISKTLEAVDEALKANATILAAAPNVAEAIRINANRLRGE